MCRSRHRHDARLGTPDRVRRPLCAQRRVAERADPARPQRRRQDRGRGGSRRHGPRPKPDAPYEYVADLVELARRSDFLMVACKGGDETRGLISASVIDVLGPEGTLINIARGTVVDEPAMIARLRDGRLGFAALDV